MLIAEAP